MGFIDKITGLMNGEAGTQGDVKTPETPEDGAPSADGETGQGDSGESKTYTQDEAMSFS